MRSFEFQLCNLYKSISLILQWLMLEKMIKNEKCARINMFVFLYSGMVSGLGFNLGLLRQNHA